MTKKFRITYKLVGVTYFGKLPYMVIEAKSAHEAIVEFNKANRNAFAVAIFNA